MAIKKSFGADFKARVALLALQEDRTVSEISSEYGVHAVQINRWKKIVRENLSQLFMENAGRCDHLELIEKLYRNIGELKVENDWVKKKLGL